MTSATDPVDDRKAFHPNRSPARLNLRRILSPTSAARSGILCTVSPASGVAFLSSGIRAAVKPSFARFLEPLFRLPDRAHRAR